MKQPHYITGTDMLNGNFPETQWIAKGFVPAEGVAALTGSPKFGKSLMALDLAASVAAGRPAWGDVETKKTGALFLGLLDDSARMNERLRAQGFTVSGDMSPLVFLHKAPKLDKGFGEWLEKELRRHPEVGLVVIDPVESVSAGSIANALAALSVQRLGTTASMPLRAEIDAFLREHG